MDPRQINMLLDPSPDTLPHEARALVCAGGGSRWCARAVGGLGWCFAWAIPAIVITATALLPMAGHLAQGAEDNRLAAQHKALQGGEVTSRRDAAVWLGANGTGESVPLLVESLRDPDAVVRMLAEHSIWQVWMRSGNAAVDQRLAEGNALLRAGQMAEAVVVFTEVVAWDGEFAEGYNKRATALYHLGDYHGSLKDIEEVLARNPYHFGALSGAGLCMIGLNQPAAARHYFQRALELNPNMLGVVELMQRLLQGGAGQVL